MVNIYVFNSMVGFDEVLVIKVLVVFKVIYKYCFNRLGLGFEILDSYDMFKFFVFVYDQVWVNQIIKMCFFVFFFKFLNDKCKVFGCFFDMVEQFVLVYLNGLCVVIEDIYFLGVELIIIFDGLVYNDFLGVFDKYVWVYG